MISTMTILKLTVICDPKLMKVTLGIKITKSSLMGPSCKKITKQCNLYILVYMLYPEWTISVSEVPLLTAL